MKIAKSPTPDELARACADAMWKEDNASGGLGMEILDIGAGRATLTMTVKENMVNGHGIAHGGFIFTLADSTFAFACNSYNERAVAAHCNISFIRPGKLGDRLVATAREISRPAAPAFTISASRWTMSRSPNCAAIPAPSAARWCR